MRWLKHIVIYTLENRSFDQVLGHFPGVDGLRSTLTVPTKSGGQAKPFPFRWYSPGRFTNLNHSWDAIHAEWNEGAMNGFARTDGVNAMGYYTPDAIGQFMHLAEQARVLDHYCCAVLGPTFPNRLYQVAGWSHSLKNDPAPFSRLSWTLPTVFDQLETKKVSWRLYIGDYCLGPLGSLLATQIQFCPPLWFSRFHRSPLVEHLTPWRQFLADVREGPLPFLTYLYPGIRQSGHPPIPITEALGSAVHVFEVLRQSRDWPSTLLVINFDEAGGYFDHVPPPMVDAFGPGIRVPALLLSAHLSPGVVHDVFDHTSVLRFVEEEAGVPLLGQRTNMMASLASALL